MWALPIVKDVTFWDNMAKGFTEAGTPFGDRSSNSSAESDGYWTLYPDNNEGKGLMVPPSIHPSREGGEGGDALFKSRPFWPIGSVTLYFRAHPRMACTARFFL